MWLEDSLGNPCEPSRCLTEDIAVHLRPAGLALRLPDVDFDDLIDWAERQRADLEPYRVRAGTDALALS
jgi:hypothetical protein